MKYIKSFVVALYASFFLTHAAAAAQDSRKIVLQPSQSQFTWLAKKVTGQHHGNIQLKSGEVTLSQEKLSGGKIVMDLNSISCIDLEDQKTNAKLIGHLKSEDFFDVEKYPDATLIITKVQPLKSQENTHQITGNLTLKEATHPITFPAKIVVDNQEAHATGTMVINRTLWNIRYGSGKFFKGLGDKMIYDNFEVSFDIKASLK